MCIPSKEDPIGGIGACPGVLNKVKKIFDCQLVVGETGSRKQDELLKSFIQPMVSITVTDLRFPGLREYSSYP